MDVPNGTAEDKVGRVLKDDVDSDDGEDDNRVEADKENGSADDRVVAVEEDAENEEGGVPNELLIGDDELEIGILDITAGGELVGAEDNVENDDNGADNELIIGED